MAARNSAQDLGAVLNSTEVSHFYNEIHILSITSFAPAVLDDGACERHM